MFIWLVYNEMELRANSNNMNCTQKEIVSQVLGGPHSRHVKGMGCGVIRSYLSGQIHLENIPQANLTTMMNGGSNNKRVNKNRKRH
jgi:hypothetical protein